MLLRLLKNLQNKLLPPADGLAASLEVRPWYPIRLLGLYRVFIAVLIASFFFSGIALDTLGTIHLDLFKFCCIIYLLLAIVWLFLIHFRLPRYQTQVYIQITTDIILLSLMSHASGGLSSGLAILLVVYIGGSVLLLSGMAGFIFAALATVVLLLEHIIVHITTGIPASSYPQVGALGAAFFGTAALMLVLKRRVQESELLAEQRGLDIANLAQLNDQIIQQMQSGVIVIDHELQVRLINRAARLQLGHRENSATPLSLETLSKELSVRYSLWLNDPDESPARIRSPGSPFELQPHFTPLGPQGGAGTLLILEDTTPYSREFQSIKLASLGRLTASIAHEIRNPLSAIQHASQLLDESPQLTEHDQRLTEIIRQQTERMNLIIENIMQLSLKEKITPDMINLGKWLEDFREDFCSQYALTTEQLRLSLESDSCNAYFDPTQLHQIVWNLCANSRKYGCDKNGKLQIDLTVDRDDNNDALYLEIADYGEGIPASLQDQVFEPFFSSSNNSPGLGLYIVRELCEFNQAQIRYIDDSKRGALFRISFANPAKFGISP